LDRRPGSGHRPPGRAGALARAARKTGRGMESLSVALDARSYPIHIGAGLLGDAKLFAPYLAGEAAAIVTNAVVAPLYLAKVKAALGGARAVEIVVEDGE